MPVEITPLAISGTLGADRTAALPSLPVIVSEVGLGFACLGWYLDSEMFPRTLVTSIEPVAFTVAIPNSY